MTIWYCFFPYPIKQTLVIIVVVALLLKLKPNWFYCVYLSRRMINCVKFNSKHIVCLFSQLSKKLYKKLLSFNQINAKFSFRFFLVDDIDVDGPCDIDSGNSTNHSPDDAQRNLLTTSTTEGKLHCEPRTSLKLERRWSFGNIRFYKKKFDTWKQFEAWKIFSYRRVFK